MLRETLQHRRKRAILIVFMTAILALVWSPVLDNDFLTNWDDQRMVTGNPQLQMSTPDALQDIFLRPYGGQYSPLNSMAYLTIVKLVGMKPFGFHLYSILFHLLNFVLVGLVLQKLLYMMPNLEMSNHRRRIIAWLTAFLFAVHPMQVESVAWISASKIILYSFFYLLGLWFYLSYRQTSKKFYYWLVLACFLASLLSKEQAVVFVLTLILIDYSVNDLSSKNVFRISKELWVEKIPFFLLGILFTYLTLSISIRLGTGGEAYLLGQRVLFANYSFWEYMVKLVAPYGLSHFYFYPIAPGESLPLRFWFYPMVTICFFWLLSEFREQVNRIYVFGGFFFLINIIIVLHLFPSPRESIIADRYVYLSSIGFFLIAVYAINRVFSKIKKPLKYFLITIGISYLIIISSYTHLRIHVWQNMESLNAHIQPQIDKHLDHVILPSR